ncbi:MAG: 4-hydroxythreonine-4-phosphate dehydrogenase PdxA [Pseudomonadota bacterium]
MKSQTKRVFALTMGEPAGVGAEISVKTWKNREKEGLSAFFLIDNHERLSKTFPDIDIQIINSPGEAFDVFDKALPVMNIDLNEDVELGVLNPKNGSAVIQSIKKAVNLTLEEKVSGIITNPIHKAALYDIGFEFDGHTEFLANLCQIDHSPIMMLACSQLKVVPLTIHVALDKVPSLMSKDLITDMSHRINDALRIDFGIQNPRLAITGLNPHAGEGGAMGNEEIEIIEPAIEELRNEGLNVIGPLPADTAFHEEARQAYDAALCMYHDQALIPIKTLDFHGGVNVTLGLPIVRTSPDHGTALNIAGQDVANPSSLIAAIKMADMIAKNRENNNAS